MQNNSADNLTVSADGNFVFSTPIIDGDKYNVTVITPPATATCTVTNGNGTVAAADVTNVEVDCL